MKKYTGPMRFAHRGVVQSAPENTMRAFQAAVDEGYEGIEIDVQLSKDGEVIIAHDKNFTRMTLGYPTEFCNGRICEMDWKDIVSVELPYANHTLPVELPACARVEQLSILPSRLMGQEGGSDYQAAFEKEKRMTHLSRFVDFDKWLAEQDTDILIEIEIKAAGVVPRLMEIISASKNAEQYIVFSGDRNNINEIQDFCKKNGKPAGLRLGANIRELTDEWKQLIPEMDLYEVGLNDQKFTEEDVRWLKDHNIVVFSNLGDYPEWWEKLVKSGAVAFKTNYPAAYTKWWNEQNQ